MPNPTITFENASIRFRNFAGKAGTYNAEGDRNFCLLLDSITALEMQANGWNIKYLKPRSEGEEAQPYIQVAVSYRKKAPRIVTITSKGKTPLGEDEINILDWAEIENTDLIVEGSPWDVNGKQGIKAYLKSLYVTLVEDELELKYAEENPEDVPDSAQNCIGDECFLPPWNMPRPESI